MSFCRLCVLAVALSAAEAAKPPPVSTVPLMTPEQEKAAQALVASLLKERSSGAVETLPSGHMQWVPSSSLEAQQGDDEATANELRKELEEVLNKDLIPVFESDLASIKKELEPTFKAMPKNEYGELGHTAVRYMLHRLFVARHAWYIKGLDPEGNNYNGSSPGDVLKGQVPDSVHLLVEKLLYGRGFGISEVALLGAILENVIHQEAISRSMVVFKMFDMDTDKEMEMEDVAFAIDCFMCAYITGKDVTQMTKSEMLKDLDSMSEMYPNWETAKQFTRKIQEDKYGQRPLTFKEADAVMIEVVEKHGSWQQRECLDLKGRLMTLEEQKDGCVPVSNFYKSMVAGNWQFSESPEYLRELGALDDSDAQNLRVMIPNYIDGASNCVASSGYYSVCCINECEGILGQMEQRFQEPDASPDELARFVAVLPSSTVSSERTLPIALVNRLEKIAMAHGGRVPFHSRLFMQWMHNAYPHECPYPHVSGTKKPRSPVAWMAATHKSMSVTEAEATALAVASGKLMVHRQGQCGQWLDQEELYVPWTNVHPQQAEMESRDEYVWAGASSMALIVALASMMLMVIQGLKSFRSASKRQTMLMA
jgi:hypothetical protein